MAYLKKDEDTGVVHIATASDIALCGLMPGWTREQDPEKEKYGSTCFECIEEIRELKKLKAN